MAKPKDLNADNFGKEVLGKNDPVLVDFWSATCPHCLQLAPEFDKAADLGQNQVAFAKVSVQEARSLFVQYGVNGVPTLILFRGTKEIARRPGAATSDQILSWLKENL